MNFLNKVKKINTKKRKYTFLAFLFILFGVGLSLFFMNLRSKAAGQTIDINIYPNSNGKDGYMNPYDYIITDFLITDNDGVLCQYNTCIDDEIIINIYSEKGEIFYSEHPFYDSKIQIVNNKQRFLIDPVSRALGKGSHSVTVEISINGVNSKKVLENINIVDPDEFYTNCGNNQADKGEFCDDGNRKWNEGNCDPLCRFNNTTDINTYKADGVDFGPKENILGGSTNQEFFAMYGNAGRLSSIICTDFFKDNYDFIKNGYNLNWGSHRYYSICADYTGNYPDGYWENWKPCQQGFTSMICAPDFKCNYDNICGAGENSINCSADCKPNTDTCGLEKPQLLFGTAGIKKQEQDAYQYSNTEVLYSCRKEYKLIESEGGSE